MATGPRALVRAGDGTVGTPVAMAGGIILVTPSQAGERGMASRGTTRGIVVINYLPPSAQLDCDYGSKFGGISGHVFNLERPP